MPTDDRVIIIDEVESSRVAAHRPAPGDDTIVIRDKEDDDVIVVIQWRAFNKKIDFKMRCVVSVIYCNFSLINDSTFTTER